MERVELTETSAASPQVFARAFLRLWGRWGALMFLLAAGLTALVTVPYPQPRDAQPLPIGIYGRYGAAAQFETIPSLRPQIEFDESPGAAARYQWRFRFPDGTRLLIVPTAGGPAPSCRYDVPGGDALPVGITSPDGGFVEIPIGPHRQTIGDLLAPPPVVCTVTKRPEVESTFASRELRVIFRLLPLIAANTSLAQTLATPAAIAHLNFSGQIAHAEAMEVHGGFSTSQSGTELYPAMEASLEYDNSVAAGWRDAIFVTIGALVAIGAAMWLEAFRPFVENRAKRDIERRT